MSEVNDVLDWLTSFTQFFLKNHDVEPVTNAFMLGLLVFNAEFIQNVNVILAEAESDTLFLPRGLVAQIIFISTTTNLLHVYANYISIGAGRNEITKAFKESAKRMLAGHEKLLHIKLKRPPNPACTQTGLPLVSKRHDLQKFALGKAVLGCLRHRWAA